VDSAAQGVTQTFLDQGLLGAAVVALVIALGLCLRHIITLYKEKDAIRKEQIGDTKIALEAVAKSTDNLNSAEERMAMQTEATKELLAVTRSLMNKGRD
jgi:hypothetical protein